MRNFKFFKTAISTVFILAWSLPASAVIIDFDTGIPTGSFSGIFAEDGFTLDFTSMFGGSGSTSTPDREIERLFGTGGTLKVTRTDGGRFTFDAIDWESERGTATIMLDGFLGISLEGTDTFVTSSSYSTFGASVLSGVSIDSLLIKADRDSSAVGAFDTLVLTRVPEPTTLALLGLGLAGLGYRRKTKAA